jgi:translocation and assembly module TamA
LQAGLKFEKGEATDALGQVNLGVPLAIRYDWADKLLDPSRGVRVTAAVTPYPSLLGSAGFTNGLGLLCRG